MLDFQLRSANRDDAETLLYFIGELARYENLSDKVLATTSDIIKHGFSERPYFEAILAEKPDRAPLGMALYFFTFSTFLAKPTLYLEDLFVLPEFRGHGIGKAFFKEIVKIAQKKGCGRVEWSVLDWNAPAKRLYQRLGAEILADWRIVRLSGEALARVAKRDGSS